MFGSAVVDVTISIGVLYLAMALFCTAIQEWIAQILDLRAKHLKSAIKLLIAGTERSNADANAVLEHPTVKLLAVHTRIFLGPWRLCDQSTRPQP